MSASSLLYDAAAVTPPTNVPKASAMRAAFLFWAFGLFIIWAYASVVNGRALQPIPESVITVLGLLVGGKAVQRFGERH